MPPNKASLKTPRVAWMNGSPSGLPGIDSPACHTLQQAGECRWVQINERKTTEGGTVAVYTNITATKRAEEKIRKAKGKLEAANALVTDEKQRARSLVEQT